MRRLLPLALAALAVVSTAPWAARAGDPWPVFAETGTIEIVTHDEDGQPRETPVWIVVLDGGGYVRTNDSRWLANIRRGSPVALRAEGVELAVHASERSDPAEYARVEEAFKAKYGLVQRVMSALRMRRPTLLRLESARRGAVYFPSKSAARFSAIAW